MSIHATLSVVLQLLSLVSALPPTNLRLPSSSSLNVDALRSSRVANITQPGFLPNLTKVLTSFPPGPPSSRFFYIIPDSELGVTFSPLGLIPHRNEPLVRQTILEAIHASLDYRVSAKMPGHGYKLQERNVLIGVNHAVGSSEITWGMWTVVLTGLSGYVQAYPGYDFLFEVKLMERGALEGWDIASGFVMTRGR